MKVKQQYHSKKVELSGEAPTYWSDFQYELLCACTTSITESKSQRVDLEGDDSGMQIGDFSKSMYQRERNIEAKWWREYIL